MPVITPAYPQMCATFNITNSTKKIIQRELERGAELTDKILLGQLAWKDMFPKHTFFTQDHKYYLAVIATSTTKDAHKIWAGFIESKVRILVGDVERSSSIALARPFVKGFERRHRVKNDDETIAVQDGSFAHLDKEEENSDSASEGTVVYTTTYYVGLELKEGRCSVAKQAHTTGDGTAVFDLLLINAQQVLNRLICRKPS